MRFCVKTSNSHGCFVPSPFCSRKKSGFKVTIPKLVGTLWFAQCCCRNVLSSHHKRGSEWGTWKTGGDGNWTGFYSGPLLELFICCICLWSSQWFDSSPGITGSGGKTQSTFQIQLQCTHRLVPVQSGANASRRQTYCLLGCKLAVNHCLCG